MTALVRDEQLLVRVEQLAVGYGGAPVIHDIDFVVEPGQSVAVLGPNGGGKTTLLLALLGRLRPAAGRARVVGRPAYVAQTERTRLDFPVSALDVALMGALAHGRWWLPARRSERAAAARALERVGLAGVAGTPFGELSGGQRQRVRLARALVQDERVLLLDEPFAGVDRPSAETLETLLRELRDEGRALLTSTHDVEGARRFDRVLCLNARQIAYGPPEECLRRPVLEQTYGSEIVVLEEDGRPLRAVAVQHHDH